jgi:serine/threonine protein kinase
MNENRLKRNRRIPEKDARTILMQIMSGLRYLNKPQRDEKEEEKSMGSSNSRKISIIHYDLKPGEKKIFLL